MTILRIGSSGKYSENWEQIFSGRAKKKASGATSKKTAKAAKKKPAAKKRTSAKR